MTEILHCLKAKLIFWGLNTQHQDNCIADLGRVLFDFDTKIIIFFTEI